VNNLVVIKKKSDKSNITDYGSADKFLSEVSYLLGDQSYAGQTMSEGGFAPNKVSAASLLDVQEVTDKNGKKYYTYELLVRTGAWRPAAFQPRAPAQLPSRLRTVPCMLLAALAAYSCACPSTCLGCA
jgi:hypothetical protein